MAVCTAEGFFLDLAAEIAALEEASALALVGAKDQGVRVRFAFAPGLDDVLADKVLGLQVLLNLVRKASRSRTMA